MKLLMLSLVLMLSGFAYAPPTCPDSTEYYCLLCTKNPLTGWYVCCMTPAPGWCCPCECRNIECVLGWVDCPIFGDGVERHYYWPPEYKVCSQPSGECR